MIQLDDIVTNRKERDLHHSFYTFGLDVSRNNLLPGHYYALECLIPNFDKRLIPNNEEEWKEDPTAFITNKQYIDMLPIGLMFHHDKWQETALMLNLKVIPPKYRAALVMAHINIIKDNLEKLNVFEDADIPTLQERRKMNLSMYHITPSILEQVSGIKIGYAMNGYKLDKVRRARILDWKHIGELPLANITMRDLNLAPGIFDISNIFQQFENKQI